MGDLTLTCPLCCNLTFNSKESLLEHITALISDVFCPVCHEKVLSLELLSAHLAHDNCSPIGPVQNIVFTNAENDDYESENSTAMEDNTHPGLSSNNISQAGVEDATDINNIQIDLMKCLQNQELKLVKEDGINRYIIVSDENGALKQEEIVTKQNNDGTVSFTSKDIKSEAQDVVLEVEEEKEDEEGTLIQEYSCSTCQMSFTSVFEHITNYHTDQDVVIEGNIGSMSELPNMEMMDTEEPAKETTSRRVITDMGNIVETPLLSKNSTEKNIVSEAPLRIAQTKSEKTGRKKYVHVENLCEGVIRDLKPSDQKPPQCHKVVIAPAVSKSGATVKMYTCTVCKIIGSQLGDFRTKPCKPVKYPCNQCELSYDNSKSLCAHMKVHKTRPGSESSLPLAKPDPETYECEICGTYFLTNKSLKLHKRMHDPIKSKPIEAPKNCASGDDRYQCNVCGKMIPLGYRAVHKASHEHDKMLNCGICNKKFSSAEYLEMHMNVHNMDKPQQTRSDKSLPYSCVYCERRFARPHEKVKHERIHTGEKPHECEICGKSFRVSYCLTLHMRTHTGARPYACPHCDKRFKAHSVYNHHLLTHSEVRAYKCPFCPKAFKTSVQLAGHKNSHTKPFSCTQCNRPFASLYAVRVHTETHNRLNNLKFKCALCGASYARSFALKDHVKQVHKQELHAVDPLQLDQEDWINKNGVESDKDLTVEITDLEIPADELIVPN